MTKCCEKESCECKPVMTDCLAKEIECLWREAFGDAIILPIIGCPSKSNGVMTLTHSICLCPTVINQLPSLSPLANNAFYSAEVSCGKWLNLYEIMIPDIPGKKGCRSSGEVYTRALTKQGISVEGDHYHWKGACPTMLAINSKAIGMHPIEFSKKQICAIKKVLKKFIC